MKGPQKITTTPSKTINNRRFCVAAFYMAILVGVTSIQLAIFCMHVNKHIDDMLPEASSPSSLLQSFTQQQQQQQQQQHDGSSADIIQSRQGSRRMQLVANPPHTNGLKGPSNGNWNLPQENFRKNNQLVSPSFCGESSLDFAPFSKSSSSSSSDSSSHVLERAVGSKTIFRMSRPDLLDRVHDAVNVLDRMGRLDANFACGVFGTCEKFTPTSRHSKPFLACREDYWIKAGQVLNGVAPHYLPDQLLRNEKNTNNDVLCEISEFVSDLVANIILPSAGIEHKKCIVQEQFINQQRNGAVTLSHVHPDDTYGGVFYLDVPSGTRLCISNAENTNMKNSWYTHSQNFTENLFPQGPAGLADDYPAYVEPLAGDFIFIPVGWMNHWVPQMKMLEHEKRTSLVFNMICI